MPAVSQQQQKLFGLALAVKRGEVPSSEVSDEVKAIVDRMSEKDIKDFAGTEHSGLPKKVEQKLREMLRELMRETAINEADPCWKGYQQIGMKTKDGKEVPNCVPESINELASRTAVEIGALTGMSRDFIQKFVDTHNLDIEKVFQFVKKGNLKDRMDFVTGLAGKPNNPYQTKLIKMFGESVNEASNDKQKVVDYLVKKGNNKNDAQKMVDKNYDYVSKKYNGASVSKKAEIISGLQESLNEDTKKRFDVDFYKGDGDRQTSHEEIIRGDKFSDVVSQATKVAKSKGMNYVEFYYKDSFIGSIDKRNNYTFKKGRNSEKSPLSVNEGQLNIGDTIKVQAGNTLQKMNTIDDKWKVIKKDNSTYTLKKVGSGIKVRHYQTKVDYLIARPGQSQLPFIVEVY